VTAVYDLELTEGAAKAGLVTVRVRYKSPEGGASEELAFPMEAKSALASFGDSPRDLRLATAIAGFADALRGAPGGPGLDQVLEVANKAAADSKPERELIELIEKAIKLGGPTKRAQVVKE
jgi:Ca-activated chloride channel family protein